MKRILVTDVGRSPALNFCRSIRLANEDIEIVGIDSNKFSLTWAEADIKVLVPKCKNEKYIKLINHLIDKYHVDFVYPSKTGQELLTIAENRDKLHATVCLPSQEDIVLFEDKWKTYNKLKDTNLCSLPESYMIYGEEDLFEHMKQLSGDFKKEVWIRRIYGSGGACAIPTYDFELAKSWINRFDGWGKFMISEKLTKKTLTWSGIWDNGNLVVSLIRERLYWEFADRSPAGVTGITGAQRIIESGEISRMSENVVRYLSENPHGCICVDYTLDEEGVPNLTEIQASRSYTSSLFMTKCGLNLPYILYKVGMGLPVTEDEKQRTIDSDKIWLKYCETYPGLVNISDLENSEADMQELLLEIANE